MLASNTHILFNEFDYLEPTTLYEATGLLEEYGSDAQVMAGGTDLVVQMKMERRMPRRIITLKRIPTLGEYQRVETGGWKIGAMTSIRAIYKSPISNLYPALGEACNWFSTVQIMHMATIGGNLCNASPAADTAPAVVVLGADAALQSKSQERIVPLADFFVGPGKTVLRAGELLTRVDLPPPAAGEGSAFLKMSRVVADISQVCVAARVTRAGKSVRDARIALGSVAPTPVRAVQAERELIGQTFSRELAEKIGEIAAQEIKPIDDVRATREYRQHIARVLVRDALLKSWDVTLGSRPDSPAA